MSRNPNDTGKGRLRIQAEVLDVRKDEAAPTLFAYAFGQSGKLLARTELKEGSAELNLPEFKEPENVRVVVGPNIEGEEPTNILSTLTRINAPDVAVRSDQISEAISIPINGRLWVCWTEFCWIRGTLLKRTISGGVNVDLPVCGAEVEIYEVDPVSVIFPKIPDFLFERIRDLVRKPWPPPPPEERAYGGIPFPPEPPGPVPFLEGRSTIQRAPLQIKAPAVNVRDEVLAIMAEMRGEDDALSGGENKTAQDQTPTRLFSFPASESSEVDPEEALGSVRALAEVPEIKSAANVSLSTFKSALLLRPELLRSLLCWIYPRAVNMQLIATTITDECGRFTVAKFFTGCPVDQPDLYFKAYRSFGFFRIQIYGPLPVACYTWWDYVCGSEVTLITKNPFAVTCVPCKPVIAPPRWVLAMAVGNTSLADIRGTSTALQPTTDASNIGLTSDGAPFGGKIRLRFEFDNTLRTELNVRYYRIRWRKLGTLNPYVDLQEDVWRHYAHMVGTTLMIEPYKLGPQPVGSTPHLYEIPPALPPVGQWTIPDAVVDTTSTAFPDSLAPAGGGEGNYSFELTLFDASGNAVNANTLGINYVIPTTLDLTATIPTANASLLGLVTAAGRFVFQLHVDNNSCVAALGPPDISGAMSADPCGLLRYEPGDSVTLHWTAAHPHQFATFKHAVVKGATELPAPITTSGTVTPAPGTHNETRAVSDLLGTCTIAGFAETVSAWAMATDGWSRQSQYDRHAIQAFALAPVDA